MTNDALYKKYAHILHGSIETIPKGTTILCGKNYELISHGKICVIKCANIESSLDCLKTRIINIQDAKQVIRCHICARKQRNIRRRKQK